MRRSQAESSRKAIRLSGWRLWCAACFLLLVVGCEPPDIGPNGVKLAFGQPGLGPSCFVYPRAISIASDDSIFVVDKSARIQRFSPKGTFETEWLLPQKQAGKPVGLYAHTDGRLFVPDTHYNRILVYDRDGNELARFGEEGTGDGQFLLPTDVAVDQDGFIYVSEYNGNDRITKWSPDFRFVSVFAGGEIEGKPFARPSAIEFDDDQTLWVVDSCNHRILQFDRNGTLLTSFGSMGKQPGKLRYPYDIAITRENDIMVCEYGNHRVQFFDTSGKSLGTWGVPGRDIGQIDSPWGAAINSEGMVFVVDSRNSRVQGVRVTL